MLIKKVNLIIWGKEFSVPVEYADSAESEAFADIEQTVREFAVDSPNITSKSIHEVTAYVKRTAEAIGVTASENLFECATPHMLLVGVDKGCVNIALLCGFKYDPEHDIAIVYSNKSLVEVGSQDLISWW